MRMPSATCRALLTLLLLGLLCRSVAAVDDVQPTSQPSLSGPGLGATTEPTEGRIAAAVASGDLASLSLEELMNVNVTTVSRQKQAVSQTPAAVTVIGQEDISRSGMTTIPDLLRLAPGMDVARLNASQWAVTSRGFNDVFANKLLVLMDGRSIYTPLFGGVYWDTVDYVLPDLDHIEVVRGPGGTMWGANAVNGVINITTKSARDTQGWFLDAMGGNEEQQGSVRFGGKIDDETYFRVYTKYRNFDSLDNFTGQSANDNWQSLQSGFRMDRYASPNDTITFQGDLYGEDLNENLISPVLTPPYDVIRNVPYTADGGNVLGRWTHQTSDTSDLAVQAYYDRLDRFDKIYTYQQDTFDLDLQDRFALGDRNEVICGGGYRFISDRFNGKEGSYVSPRDHGTVIANTFIQDDFTLIPSTLHAYAGTKLEYNTYTDFEVEPQGRLLWTPDEKNTFWGSIARAVRTPTRYEEDMQLLFRSEPVGGTPADVVFFNNPDLKSEDLLAFELGYRVRPSKSLTFDLSTFYNRYENLVGQQSLPPALATSPSPHLNLDEQWENRLHGETYGGELAATWNVTTSWKLIASYTFLNLQLHHDPGDTGTGETYFEGTSPQNQFQVRSYLNLTRNLELNGAAYYVGPLQQGVPAYVRLDAGLAWHPRENLEVALVGQNLLNSRHLEFPSSGAYTAPSEVVRDFYARVTWRF